MTAVKRDKDKEAKGTPGSDSIEALRAGNELFSLFMRHSPVYAYIKMVTPTESRIMQASDNYQQMLGISSLDIVGKTMADLFPSEFASKITADDWVAFANGNVLILDKYMNDRSYVTIKFPFVHGDKNILAGYIVDVTEHEQAEKELRASEENFRRSHDESPLGVCVVTAEGEILYANRTILDMYGYDSIEELKATSLQEKYTPECYAEHRVREEKQRRGEQVPSTYEIDIIGKEGRVRNIEVFRKEMLWSGVKQFQLFHNDITERRGLEEKLRRDGETLRAGEEKLRGETESVRAREEALRAETESVRAREEALGAEAESLKMREEALRAETDSLGAGVDRLCRESETLQASDEKLRECRETLRKDREALRADGDKLSGEKKALRMETESLRAEEEKLREKEKALSTEAESLRAREEALRAETESLRAREEKLSAKAESLKAEEEKLRILFEAVGAAIAATDMTGKIVDVNNAWLQLSGYNDRAEVIGRNRRDLVSEKDRDMSAEGLANAGAAGTGVSAEITMLRKDGSEYLCEAINTVMCDAAGNAVGVVYVDRDITNRRTAEKMVLASLVEKELLLDEINRQARNNLNAVIALMEMQWRTGEKSLWRPAPVMTAASIATIENRIKTMALVHERLCQSTSISLIDAQDYLGALVANLRTSLNISPEISCSVNAAGVVLRSEIAVTVGMIVNELATNAFKYAFPDNKPQFGADKCGIAVSLERKGEEHTLIVDDNGVGLPKSFRLAATPTLGLHLVKMLGVDQLGGKLALNRTRGTRYVLKFKVKE